MQGTQGPSAKPASNKQLPRNSVESSDSEEDCVSLTEDDMYHVSLLDKLDHILANRYGNTKTG